MKIELLDCEGCPASVVCDKKIALNGRECGAFKKILKRLLRRRKP